MSTEENRGTREFKWPVETMINAINDLAELQKGEVTSYDIQQGKFSFEVEMYGFVWEYRFTVTDRGEDTSLVTLEIEGDVTKKEVRISRQLALLESLLIGISIDENSM